MERDLGERAGLGFVGKNTLLIAPKLGSGMFLGEVLTTLPLPVKQVKKSRAGCGKCTRCIDACPTKAFVAPYILDARKCISYLTIEHKGTIPMDLRPAMANRIYGCDVCQQVCPWNKFEWGDATGSPLFGPAQIKVAGTFFLAFSAHVCVRVRPSHISAYL
jgi:epoxyqueuosine reductase